MARPIAVYRQVMDTLDDSGYSLGGPRFQPSRLRVLTQALSDRGFTSRRTRLELALWMTGLSDYNGCRLTPLLRHPDLGDEWVAWLQRIRGHLQPSDVSTALDRHTATLLALLAHPPEAPVVSLQPPPERWDVRPLTAALDRILSEDPPNPETLVALGTQTLGALEGSLPRALQPYCRQLIAALRNLGNLEEADQLDALLGDSLDEAWDAWSHPASPSEAEPLPLELTVGTILPQRLEALEPHQLARQIRRVAVAPQAPRLTLVVYATAATNALRWASGSRDREALREPCQLLAGVLRSRDFFSDAEAIEANLAPSARSEPDSTLVTDPIPAPSATRLVEEIAQALSPESLKPNQLTSLVHRLRDYLEDRTREPNLEPLIAQCERLVAFLHESNLGISAEILENAIPPLRP